MSEPTYPAIDRRAPGQHDYPSQACNLKIEGIKGDLKTDIHDIKMSLKDLSLALSKLVLLEERQSQQFLAQERIFKVLEKLESRMTDLERKEPLQSQATAWVSKVIWAAAAVTVLLVLKKVGMA